MSRAYPVPNVSVAAACGFAALAFLSGVGAAWAAPRLGNPTPYAKRGLTLPAGMLRVDNAPADWTFLSENRGWVITKGDPPIGIDPEDIDLGNFGALRAGGQRAAQGAASSADLVRAAQQLADVEVDEPSDVAFGISVGAGYGIMEDLEVGIVLLALQFEPTTDYMSLDFYGRYRFFNQDNIEIGGQLDLSIIATGFHDFGLGLGLPVLMRLSDQLRFDTGGQFRFLLGDANTVQLRLPAVLNYQFTPILFAGARSGITVFDMGESASAGIPLGVQGGVSVAEGLVDITAWWQWPLLVGFGGDDHLHGSYWELGFGANFWFQFL